MIWPQIQALGGPIRVVQYRFKSSAWTSTSHDLTLLHNLEPDYFVMIQGGQSGAGSASGSDAVRVTQDPFGTGSLGVSSGSNIIRIERSSSALNSSWFGTVTVVENRGSGTSGFTLNDVLTVNMPASPGSSPQDVTATTSWTDINQVVPFGGPNGGGSEFDTGGSSARDGQDTLARIFLTEPSGTPTVNLRRRSQDAANIKSVDFVVYVIEWGSDWTIQSVDITGTNAGAGIDATGEYTTGTINSVNRDNTFVFGTGTTDATSGAATSDNVIGSAHCLVYTLGDGVTQNSTETSVAVGQEVNDGTGLDATVYTLSNPDLAVDYRFKADAADVSPHSITVDAAISSESYDTAANPETAEGRRAALMYTSMDDASINSNWAELHQRPIFTSGTNVDWYRTDDSFSWVSWLQSIDFGNVGLGQFT